MKNTSCNFSLEYKFTYWIFYSIYSMFLLRDNKTCLLSFQLFSVYLYLL